MWLVRLPNLGCAHPRGRESSLNADKKALPQQLSVCGMEPVKGPAETNLSQPQLCHSRTMRMQERWTLCVVWLLFFLYHTDSVCSSSQKRPLSHSTAMVLIRSFSLLWCEFPIPFSSLGYPGSDVQGSSFNSHLWFSPGQTAQSTSQSSFPSSGLLESSSIKVRGMWGGLQPKPCEQTKKPQPQFKSPCD